MLDNRSVPEPSGVNSCLPGSRHSCSGTQWAVLLLSARRAHVTLVSGQLPGGWASLGAPRSVGMQVMGGGEQSPPLSGDSCKELRPFVALPRAQSQWRAGGASVSTFMSFWEGSLGLLCPLLGPHGSSGPRGILGPSSSHRTSGVPSGSSGGPPLCPSLSSPGLAWKLPPSAHS